MRLALAYILMLVSVATVQAHAHVNLSEKSREMPTSMLFEVSSPEQLSKIKSLLPDDYLPNENLLPKLLTLKNETARARKWTLTRPVNSFDKQLANYTRYENEGFSLLPSQTLNWPAKIVIQSLTIPPYQQVEVLLDTRVLPTQIWSHTWLTHRLNQYSQYSCLMLGAIFSIVLLQVIMGLLKNNANLLLLCFQLSFLVSLSHELGLVEILIPSISSRAIGFFLPILSLLLFIHMRRKQNQEMNNLVHSINVTLYGTAILALLVTTILTQVSLPILESILPTYLAITLSTLVILCGYTFIRFSNVHHLCDFGIIVFMALFCIILNDIASILDKMLLYLPVLGINLLCFVSAQISESKNLSNNKPLANVQKVTLERKFKELEMNHRLLQEKNAIDFLTGLKNRQFFDERYHQELSRSARENTPISLIIIDLDHFKRVNDHYGHQVGDEVLKMVAKRFYYALNRPADAICRYGGEEFVILLPNTHIQGAAHLAQQLSLTISSKPILTSRGDISITISQGVACVSHQADFEEMKLLSIADEALYRAKSLGRNRFELARLEPFIVKEQA
ncbi:diguanylate cyclase (GGDEF) domain-containing protein [Shewanella psychrophila]|uniref:diguanylate cyclase n=1 Tax=Shewanella psychrophila TaxID=225848 RepID=A0A1S6HQ31_9GAMM|nr:GGDEF domain-containing protein [Shewanella psychrophila]AQS37608.1 diguanylate cyclase (GGDEF) domain-containing protein [Shewanella psychrophila]